MITCSLFALFFVWIIISYAIFTCSEIIQFIKKTTWYVIYTYILFMIDFMHSEIRIVIDLKPKNGLHEWTPFLYPLILTPLIAILRYIVARISWYDLHDLQYSYTFFDLKFVGRSMLKQMTTCQPYQFLPFSCEVLGRWVDFTFWLEND